MPGEGEGKRATDIGLQMTNASNESAQLVFKGGLGGGVVTGEFGGFQIAAIGGAGRSGGEEVERRDGGGGERREERGGRRGRGSSGGVGVGVGGGDGRVDSQALKDGGGGGESLVASHCALKKSRLI